MEKVERQPHLPRPVLGYALDVAARLESAHPHFLIKILYSSDLVRQSFNVFASQDIDQHQDFLHRLAQHAPDVLHGLEHLDPLAQVARALILLKPRRVVEAIFGSCPDGYLGLLSRLGCDPLPSKETYRAAFDLFSNPRHRHRAKVLGQLEGQLLAEHIALAAGLDEALLHPAVLRRSKSAEIPALNAFVEMITDLCGATPELIKESLDALPVVAKGVKISGWAETWMRRQVRLSVPFPVPCNDPDLRLCLGAEQISLGRRLRNCAASRMSYAFLNERVLVEWIRPGEQAVIELAVIQTGSEQRWEVTQLLGPRNRRAKTAVVAAIRERLDGLGILYQSSPFSSAERDGLHSLLEHYPHAPFPDYLAQRADDAEDEDADIDRMLEELQQEVHGLEAA